MPQQREKGERFRALHESNETFLIPNPWDAGSARLLAGLGFSALATSSAAAAGTLGQRDGAITRAEALAHARVVANAVDLPVSGDLENGFDDEPREVAETIRLAAEAGLVGGSIEDHGPRRERPIYDLGLAVERVAAAAEAARALPFRFTLTARAENFLHGVEDLDDTIRRLVAYEKAGADVLFAPGLPTLDAVRTVCASVTRPVNFVASIRGRSFTVPELRAAGVRRISVGAALWRGAMTALARAGREALEQGTFTAFDDILSSSQVGDLMGS